MKERQMAAFIGVTLIKDGRMVAAFGANNVTARVWTQTEIAPVGDVAERTWEAVERARAESALREREHRFRLALSASGGGSWTWDPRTNDTDWDDAPLSRFGYLPPTRCPSLRNGSRGSTPTIGPGCMRRSRKCLCGKEYVGQHLPVCTR